jgi:hypothetical protein
MNLELTLRFEGNSADQSLLDFYDAAVAFNGFQRSLSLTSHLILNGEIITQSPSLKNARIFVSPPEEGSWKTTAIIVGSLALGGATASRDSVLGHIFTSAYSYVINESLGFHVDFEQTLGQQIEQSRREGLQISSEIDSGKFDSLIEKVENSIKDIHRPISHSRTAIDAQIGVTERGINFRPVGAKFDIDTFNYISNTRLDENPRTYSGKVSSYNYNTFRGRVYIPEYGRSIPFLLGDSARSDYDIRRIVSSLAEGAIDRFTSDSEFTFTAFRSESRNGAIKSFIILDVH